MRRETVVRVVGTLALVAYAGCATAGSSSDSLPPARAITVDDARAAVTKVVEAQYAALEKGDPDQWAAPLAPDPVFFGTGPDDAVATKAATLKNMHAATDGKLKAGARFAVKSSGLQIGLSSDGRAAWVADVIELTVTQAGKSVTSPLRLTEVLAEQDGAWWVHAVHWSIGVPNERALAMAADGSLGKLKALGESVAPGAQAIAAEFQKTSAKIGEFLGSLSSRPDAFVFGTAPDEQLIGGDKIKETFKKQIDTLGLVITRRGGVHAGVAPNGRVGWVAANIDMTASEGGKKVNVPTRGLMVYLNESGLWRMVQAHFSNGVRELP